MIEKGWQYIRILSLDVAAGAFASGSMVVAFFDISMPLIWWIILPVSVWLIYTLDHLLDAYRLKAQAHTPRHLFHHRHFSLLAVIWLGIFIACGIWTLIAMPIPMIWLGAIMGILVFGHLLLVVLIKDRISWFLHKELGVGLIYALGVWGGPAAMTFPDWPQTSELLFFQFFCLAMMNLLMFSMYEYGIDELDGHTSFARAIGKRKTSIAVFGLGIALVAAGLYAWSIVENDSFWMKMEMLYLIMMVILVWITFQPKLFQPRERYRIWGDFVFLIPGLIWLI